MKLELKEFVVSDELVAIFESLFRLFTEEPDQTFTIDSKLNKGFYNGKSVRITIRLCRVCGGGHPSIIVKVNLSPLPVGVDNLSSVCTEIANLSVHSTGVVDNIQTRSNINYSELHGILDEFLHSN